MNPMTIRRAVLLAVPVIAIGLPLFAAAHSIPYFGPILEDGWNNCPLGWAAVIMTINNIITIALTLAISIVAPVMLAYSGFLLVTNAFNPSAKEEAKKMLTNTIIGIVIALAAWLIIDALMAVLYHPTDPGLAGQTWSSLISSGNVGELCIPVESILHQAPNGGLVTGASATSTVSVVPPSTTPANEAAVRQQFELAGVSVNKAACDPYDKNGVTSPGCTNVGGMLPSTVQQVINIKNSCGGCSVVVSGGSEAGHAPGPHSHGTGYKVDIRANSSLNAFLKGLTYVGVRTGDHSGPAYTDSCKQNQYVQESDHWDITVLGACSL